MKTLDKKIKHAESMSEKAYKNGDWYALAVWNEKLRELYKLKEEQSC